MDKFVSETGLSMQLYHLLLSLLLSYFMLQCNLVYKRYDYQFTIIGGYLELKIKNC